MVTNDLEVNMQYYITADLVRKPTAKEAQEIMVSGASVYTGRIKAVVSSDTPQNAMEAGKKMITGCLKTGITPINWGFISVSDAKNLGDTAIYKKYYTATWIGYYRAKVGLTQQQLADASGVNIRQIQRVESGDSSTGNLTARNLLAIADVLGVDPHDLI